MKSIGRKCLVKRDQQRVLGGATTHHRPNSRGRPSRDKKRRKVGTQFLGVGKADFRPDIDCHF